MSRFGESPYAVTLDRREQIIAIDAPPHEMFRGERQVEPVLSSWHTSRFVSAAVLAQKAKAVDDGIFARIELLADAGVGRLGGKRDLLARVGRELAANEQAGGDAVVSWLAACRLRGIEVALDDRRVKRVDEALREFVDDPKRSKPIGFYSWRPALETIFRSDRMLQTNLRDEDSRRALAAVIGGSHALLDSYFAHLELAARATNALSFDDLRPWIDASRPRRDARKRVAAFPPSTSPEVQLFDILIGDRPVPEGFELMREVVARVRTGEIDMKPSSTSGYYDHQLFALEALLSIERLPEAARLIARPGYRVHLEELFRSLYALTRETHAKQLECAAGGAAPPREIVVSPDLSVEPLPTYYLRRARSVAFLRATLEDVFGPGVLDRVARLTPTGEASTSIAEDLSQLEALFAGAAVTAWRELGGDHEHERDVGDASTVEHALAAFRAFREGVAKDADVGGDVRVMVPVFYDEGRRKLKVWAVLGWRETVLTTEFVQRPTVTVTAAPPPAPVYENRLQELLARRAGKVEVPAKPLDHTPPIRFADGAEIGQSLVMVEAYVEAPMNRDEFRAHCDRYVTQREIIAHLG